MTEPGNGKRLMAEAVARMRRQQARIEELESALNATRGDGAVALLGIGCRLPGAGDDLDRFWDLLVAGDDAIVPVPADRWDPARWRPDRPGQPGRFEQEHGGFVPGIADFDAGFFGIPEHEADYLDPQQRLLLETTWHALEDAGLRPDALRGQRVGVFVGLSTIDYSYAMVEDLPIDRVTAQAGPGTSHSTAAGRLSHRFGWTGPSLCIDTACSSSLIALHLAVQSLRRRECDLAIVAGANAMLSPYTTLVFDQAGMLAPDGRCKGFDASADGYGRGEGAVAIALQRAQDAATAGRSARALVRGTATNQDGPSAGLTVPHRAAQAAVLRAALADAGLGAEDLDAIEAHGTGTSLGDPIEAGALDDVFGRGRTRPLFVASVKANIGHLEAAAGLAGVVRAVLQLEHGTLAPQANFREPTPHFDWAAASLEVPRRAVPWSAASRRIGVSSFGFSGSNAHAVLEQAPALGVDPEATAPPTASFWLSARSAPALAALADRWRTWLARRPDLTLRAACALAASRQPFELQASAKPTTLAALDAWLEQLAQGEPPTDADDVPPQPGGRPMAGGPAYPFERQRHWFPVGDRTRPDRAHAGRLWQLVREPLAENANCAPPSSAARTVLVARGNDPDGEDGERMLQALAQGAEDLTIVVPAGVQAEGLVSLARVVAVERADVRIAVLRGEVDEALAEDATDEQDLLIAAGQRLAARLRPLRLSDSATFVPTPGAAYAITGAASSLGAHLIPWLLRSGADRILALHRPGGNLPALDPRVTPVALDLEDTDAVTRWARDQASIAGVFHLAGTRRDAVLASLTAADLNQALAIKARAAHALYGALRDRPEFAFFCSFGSVAAVLGNPGQAAYALANGALPSGPKAVTVAFGPWRDSTADANPAVWERRGIRPLAPVDALRDLGRILAAGTARAVCRDVLCLDVDWERLAASLPPRPDAAVHPLLRGLVAPDPRIPPALGALEEVLPDEIAALTGRALGDADRDRTLAELGVDSLLAVELRHRVAARSGVDLAMERLIGGETVRELGASRSPEMNADLLAEIEAMTDEEARRLLDEGDHG